MLAEASALNTDATAAKIAKCMRTAVQNIDTHKPLRSYGVDSLVAVEIRNWTFREIKSEVSLFDILSAVPITALAEKIAAKSKLAPAVFSHE